MLDFIKDIKKRAALRKLESFKTKLDAILQSHGFKKGATAWIYEGGDVDLLISLQKSQWGAQIYINTGIYLKNMCDEKNKPPISARYEMLLGDDSLPPVIDFEGSKATYDSVYKAIEKKVVPLMMTFQSLPNLKRFITKYNRKRISVSKKAMDSLNIRL